MTERTEGIKEGLELAAKWHDEQRQVSHYLLMVALKSHDIQVSTLHGWSEVGHLESAEILRAKIEEVE